MRVRIRRLTLLSRLVSNDRSDRIRVVGAARTLVGCGRGCWNSRRSRAAISKWAVSVMVRPLAHSRGWSATSLSSSFTWTRSRSARAWTWGDRRRVDRVVGGQAQHRRLVDLEPTAGLGRDRAHHPGVRSGQPIGELVVEILGRGEAPRGHERGLEPAVASFHDALGFGSLGGGRTSRVAMVARNAGTPSERVRPRPMPRSLSQINRRGTRPSSAAGEASCPAAGPPWSWSGNTRPST